MYTNPSWRSLLLALSLSLATTPSFAITAKETLGKFLYFDIRLSEPSGQSCASCHTPGAGFADPDRKLPVSEGVMRGMFGGRNAPTASYAMYVPGFNYDQQEQLYKGGLFLDGRATGDGLGDPLADQARGPFVNPVEMHNPDKRAVVRDAKFSIYGLLFASQCGVVNLNSASQVDRAYDCIATSIASFERTATFGAFNSKYDRYLKTCAAYTQKSQAELDACAQGEGAPATAAAKRTLSSNEFEGLKLFVADNNNNGRYETGEGGNCAACHSVFWTKTSDYALPVQSPLWAPRSMVPPLFTDFTYDNLGIPKSTNSIIKNNPTDEGLGGVIGVSTEIGKFRVPTLRNVSKTAPYGHNGYFPSLLSITKFYNTRDTARWAAPEVAANINQEEMGALGLSNTQVSQIAAFMATLAD